MRAEVRFALAAGLAALALPAYADPMDRVLFRGLADVTFIETDDGSRLLTRGGRSDRVWDLNTGALLPSDDEFRPAVLSPDGRWVAGPDRSPPHWANCAEVGQLRRSAT